MKDILINMDNYDIQAVNGDFAIGESTDQHQELLLLSEKGEWKENPIAGVGISTYLNDEGPSAMLRAIAIEFIRDGMTVISVKSANNGNILIDAHYGN